LEKKEAIIENFAKIGRRAHSIRKVRLASQAWRFRLAKIWSSDYQKAAG
jgi:hypothetical protein